MNSIQLEKVKNFVKETCKGRDESHGFTHMEAVANLSMEILNCKNNNVLETVILVAYLHDVADHKYDHDGILNKKVYDFLLEYFENTKNPSGNAEYILKIINKISYSKENNYIKQHGHRPDDLWIKELGEIGFKIRNIVSDADKLEALGEQGFTRCKMYHREVYFKKYQEHISEEKLHEEIVEHYHEKIKRLPSEFIRTDIGKKMAVERLFEFERCLKIIN